MPVNATGASGNRLPTNFTADEQIRANGQIDDALLKAEAMANNTRTVQATIDANRLGAMFSAWRTLAQAGRSG